MAPRPHPIVLASLVLGCLLVMALVMPLRAAGAGWRWPLRGPVVGAFHLSPRTPFAPGQRRGIDLSVRPGVVVRAACAGRVRFAGPVPRRGSAVSVRCGALVATYLGLGRLAVRAGAHVGSGEGLGTLGPSGRLRLGARRAGDRRGYLDPLTLLADERPATPRLGPAPRAPRALRRRPARPAARPPALAPVPAAAPAPARRLPWPAYPAVALVACALPVGGLVRRRRRHRSSRAARPWEECAVPGATGRAVGLRGAPCNVRCPWPPRAPSTSPRRSTTSTRPRTWGTRTRRSPST